jgi:ATP-dependent helicase/nuclease subunit B
VHALWWTRFQAIAHWFIGFEADRAAEIAARHAEIGGSLDLDAPAGPFRLTARADRVDERLDGGIEILDFKTGTPPSATQVLTGFAPQLALEAAMVGQGAFNNSVHGHFSGRSIVQLAWLGLSQVERGTPFKTAVEKDWTADGVAARALAELCQLVAAFDDESRPYVSRARPIFETRYESDYDHLARVREWHLVESEEDEQ